jgi:hypothetical protein
MFTRLNNSKPGRGSSSVIGIVVFLVILVVMWSDGRRNNRPVQHQAPPAPIVQTRSPIEDMVKPSAAVQKVDGIGFAVLVDVSGSMGQSVKDASGRGKPKIEIARNSAMAIIAKAAEFAAKNPGKPVQVAVYEFSAREHRPSCRRVVPLGPPDVDSARAAIASMYPKGGTPIGDAIVTAKQDLAASGLTKQHILVVTDGENNEGYAPQDVVSAIVRLPESETASVYFVAFDVAASRFQAVREAGGLVLAASDETQLNQTVDYVVTGRVLVEQPEAPATR